MCNVTIRIYPSLQHSTAGYLEVEDSDAAATQAWRGRMGMHDRGHPEHPRSTLGVPVVWGGSGCISDACAGDDNVVRLRRFSKTRCDYIQPSIQHSSPITGNTGISTPNGPGYQHTDHHKHTLETSSEFLRTLTPQLHHVDTAAAGFRCCRFRRCRFHTVRIPAQLPKARPFSTLLLAPSIPTSLPPLMPSAGTLLPAVHVTVHGVLAPTFRISS